MLGVAEEETARLQRPHRRRRRRHVRPLVDLVGERPSPQNPSPNTATAWPPRVRAAPLAMPAGSGRPRGHLAVCVHESPPQEVVRVDVVDAERDQQARVDDRTIVPAPGVRCPVNEARCRVGRGQPSEKRHGHPPLPDGHGRSHATPAIQSGPELRRSPATTGGNDPASARRTRAASAAAPSRIFVSARTCAEWSPSWQGRGTRFASDTLAVLKTQSRRDFLSYSAALIAAPALRQPAALRVRTIAGTGTAGMAGDGTPADKASINNPYGVFLGPDGALYRADFGSHRILRLELQGRRINVIAGDGTKGHSGDGGPAQAAQFSAPHEIRFDSKGSILVAERDSHVVRHIDMKTRIITTVAGTGVAGYSGDGGPAKAAQLNQPHSIVLDSSDNVLICDINNHRVRRIDARTGVISTFAGTGESAPSPDQGGSLTSPLAAPRSIEIAPDGTMYLILRAGHKVLALNPAQGQMRRIAGTGEFGFEGDCASGPRGEVRRSGVGVEWPQRDCARGEHALHRRHREPRDPRHRFAVGDDLHGQRARASAATGRTGIRAPAGWPALTACSFKGAASTSVTARTIASASWSE